MKAPACRLLLFGLLLVANLARADAEADANAQRLLIERERDAVEARFAEREAHCQTRFAVTDCVEAARRDRREALRPLRQRALQIDDAERRRRADERLRAIEARRARAEAAPPETVSRERTEPARQLQAPLPSPPAIQTDAVPRTPAPPRAAKPRPAKALPDVAVREQAEAESRARFETRKKAIEERRKAVERRNAERAKEGKVVRPLPVPAAASAP